MPPELRPKSENAFYKRHQDHAGFNPPPELKAVIDSQKRAEEREKEKAAAATVEATATRDKLTDGPA